MKKVNKFLSPLLLASHLIVSTLYLFLRMLGYTKLSVLYFGSESIITSFALYSAIDAKTWGHKQFIYIHLAFIFIRGIIYVLDDSGIYTTGNLFRLIFVSFFSLVIALPLFLKCYFYGYFNERI